MFKREQKYREQVVAADGDEVDAKIEETDQLAEHWTQIHRRRQAEPRSPAAFSRSTGTFQVRIKQNSQNSRIFESN